MTDCYRILGVPRHASPREIRAAYLAKMKRLHPDARREGDEADGEAGEISFAYWQLRDAERRAEHDRLLFAPAAPRPQRVRSPRGKTKRVHARPSRRKAPHSAPPKAKPAARRPRQGRRLQPLRTAAGVAACVVAIVGFGLALSYFEPRHSGRAEAATAPAAAVRAAQAREVSRRIVDPALSSAAGTKFREVVRRFGLEGANQYARQCLLELTARPTMTMLDYCVAFDDQAAEWERTAQTRGARAHRYFAEDQRFGRYRSVARSLPASPVRDAILADVSFFSMAER